MIEKKGNLLWATECDALCITTNGDIRKDGRAVMGKGTAQQAVDRIDGIRESLAKLIIENGNHVQIIGQLGYKTVVSFPTKYHWRDKSEILLIERSAGELVLLATEYGWQQIVIPRPGCGYGELRWEYVKPVLERVLDERFIVVTL